MTTFNLKERFLNLTTFREELSDLQKQSAWDEAHEELPVQIVMNQKGRPLAVVMPYRGYELLREMIFMLNARASSRFGKELSVSGPTTDDAIKALRTAASNAATKALHTGRTRSAQ